MPLKVKEKQEIIGKLVKNLGDKKLWAEFRRITGDEERQLPPERCSCGHATTIACGECPLKLDGFSYAFLCRRYSSFYPPCDISDSELIIRLVKYLATVEARAEVFKETAQKKEEQNAQETKSTSQPKPVHTSSKKQQPKRKG